MSSPDPAAVENYPGTFPDAFEQEFDGDSLVILRHGVGAHGSALGLSDERADNLMLVAQELAANAVRHGPGHGTLRLWRDGDDIHCEVSNIGAAPGGLTDIGLVPPPPGDVGGRGLWLVRHYSHSLQFGTAADATTITVTFRL